MVTLISLLTLQKRKHQERLVRVLKPGAVSSRVRSVKGRPPQPKAHGTASPAKWICICSAPYVSDA
uniref:Uncharacterized protein n=1 Tax=Thermogemmatispora argillosa TaxID=2045280 RepID=A0A455T0S5_9CHLR|nr:hypothetical protein KTA_11600 [Thermogemmatispora argillosa]